MNSEELISQLASQAGSTKGRATPGKLFAVWFTLLAAYIMLAAFGVGARPDLGQQLLFKPYQAELGALIAILASCCLSAAHLAYPDMYQKRKLVLLPALAVMAFIAVLGLEWAYATPSEHSHDHDHGYMCSLHITVMALLPACLIFYGIGRMASTHLGYAGAIAMCASFSTGALIARLSEHNDSIAHMVLWHYPPIVVASLAGVLLGRWLLKW